jgi:hypothetical protein
VEGHLGAVKPRLVFFRWLRDGLPDFIRLHLAEQVACLGRSFDVVVIGEDCDYRDVCDRYQPDLTLFESGAYAGPRRITNAAAHPDIPKLGFIHSDAYCLSRAASISDMATWGVETFFTISVALGEYTPDIAGNLFVWPNFVDGELYRDYGQSKVIPVMFAGSQATHYPWRNRMNRLVSQAYPSLTTPHGGWFNRQRSARMIYGERYARMLNAAMVVPACGTIAKELVRKVFEVPAARSCLLTERTAAIESAGFVDMHNCVFADEHDVLDKLNHLFQNPGELARITDAGHDLVHTRHTAAQRDQIFQWWRLHQALKPGERIVQTSPFAPLEVVGDTSIENTPVISHGLDRVLLREGDEELLNGRYSAAEDRYLRCLNYHFMPEPALRLAICHLYQGQPDRAMYWLTRTIDGTLLSHRAADPDPIEWAYMIRAVACAGRLADARLRAREYPHLRHPELDRTRLAVGVLAGQPGALPMPDSNGRSMARRRSVHVLPEQELVSWVQDFATMLAAGGQHRAAGALSEYAASTSRSGHMPAGSPGPADRPASVQTAAGRATDRVRVKGRLLRKKARRRIEYELRRRSPAAEPDGFSQMISALAEKEDLTSVLLLGARTGPFDGVLRAGLRANPGRPTVFSVVDPAAGGVTVHKHGGDEGLSYETPLPTIKKEHQVEAFDLVLVTDARGAAAELIEEAFGANIVLVDHINRLDGHQLCGELLADARFTLHDHDPSYGTGYALFRRSLPRQNPVDTDGQ